jgi:hypothetical protein
MRTRITAVACGLPPAPVKQAGPQASGKMTRFSIAVVLLFASAPLAFAQSIGWARQQGGTPAVGISVEEPRGIATDSLGNLYITGSFRDQATFGAGEPNETVLRIPDGFPPGTQGIFVAKYLPDGQFVWARSARGNGVHQDWAFAIAVDGAGNSYVTGAFSYLTSLVDFGNGVTLTDSGAFVAKYDTEGNAQWARTLHAAGTGWSVATDANGDSFVAGSSPDPVTGNPNATIWKVAANGGLSWTRVASGAYAGNGIGISTDGAGNVSVTGDVGGGSATFGAGEPNETILTSLSAGSVLFIAKYNTSGTLLWARQSIDEAGRTTRGEKITNDSAGNSYLVGNGFPILGPGEPNETEVERAFVAKYDASGSLVWARTLKPGLVTSFATAVAHSAAGHVYVLGGATFIQKYQGDGTLLWDRGLVLAASEDALASEGRGLALDAAGNAYVAGYFSGTVTFGPGEPGQITLSTTSGNQDFDIFLAQYLNETGPNTPPVASAAEVATAEDTELAMVLPATDADGDPLTYTIVNGPLHGALTGTAPNVTYTPHLNYRGGDSFTFRAFDGEAFSNTATVTIAVTPVNDAPSALDQVLSTPRDTPLALTLTGHDVDGDPLDFAILAGPTHGTLTGLGPDKVYTPDPGYTGPDGFTFTASDGLAVSAPATVALTVASSQLVCGALVSGSIAVAGEVDDYAFAGSNGQLISLALASTGGFTTNRGSASVQLALLAPSGAIVGTLRSNSQANFALPETGTYAVRVRATNGQRLGSYNVNLECLFPVQSPNTVVMTCGALASGTIGAPGQVNLHSYDGLAGQTLALTLANTGGFTTNRGSASAELTLFAPSGAVVGALRSNSQATFVLPESGTYVIRVSAANLAGIGSYNVNLECLLPTPSPDTVPLTCGALASGTIGAPGQVNLHSYDGLVGQTIALTLASTGGFTTNRGSASAELTLFAPSGAVVGTLRSNSQANFILAETGPHVIRVTATNLATVGSYNVNLECLFPTQSPDTVVMTCGTPTSGSIDAPGEVNLYSFLASPSPMSLTLVSTGGFASNRGSNSVALNLFTPSGVSLGTLRSNGQADFILPEQGTYVIAASAANLARTGSFDVTMVCPPD